MTAPQPGRGQPCAAGLGGVAGAEAQGLVSPIETSGTPPHFPSDSRRVDPRKARIRRMKSGIVETARAITANKASGRVQHMLTLTYAKPDEWGTLHVTEALRRFGGYCQRRNADVIVIWCAEIQEKRYLRTGDAVVHYHAIIDAPAWLPIPHFDTNGWWPHGMTQCEPARNPVGYLAKYASKAGSCALFPKGLRLFGVRGLDTSTKDIVRWRRAPPWLRATAGACGLVEGCHLRRVKGGWCNPDTGQFFESPFDFVGIFNGEVWFRPKGPLPLPS